MRAPLVLSAPPARYLRKKKKKWKWRGEGGSQNKHPYNPTTDGAFKVGRNAPRSLLLPLLMKMMMQEVSPSVSRRKGRFWSLSFHPSVRAHSINLASQSTWKSASGLRGSATAARLPRGAAGRPHSMEECR